MPKKLSKWRKNYSYAILDSTTPTTTKQAMPDGWWRAVAAV